MKQIVPFAFDSSWNQWSPVSSHNTSTLTHARLATFNILQSEYSFLRNCLLRPTTRFTSIISMLTNPNDKEYINADIIGLNEVDAYFLSMLMLNPIIQQHFYLSDIVKEKSFLNGSISTMGNLLLSRIPFDACYTFPLIRGCDRNVTVGVFCNRSLVVASIHPTAYEHHAVRRREQLSYILDTMGVVPDSSLFSNSSVFIMGDSNMHQSSENVLLKERSVLDLYHETVVVPFMKQHSSSITYPPTTDSIPNYPYGFTWNLFPLDNRSMRLDRMLQRPNTGDWVAEGPVQIFAKETIANSWYLRRSDHYGLVVDLKREVVNKKEELVPNKEYPISCVTLPCERRNKYIFF